MPIAQPGTDLSLVFAEGIGLHSVPAHHRAAHVKPQFASPETARHVMQEELYLLLVKIHQHAFHDENELRIGMLPKPNQFPVRTPRYRRCPVVRISAPDAKR